MDELTDQPLLTAISLNDLLEEIENRLGRLGMSMGGDHEKILFEMDEASIRLKSAVTHEHPLKSEEAQFEYIGKSLQKYARLFLRSIGGQAAFIKLRAQRNPPSENWWWYIDQWLEQQRISAIRRFVISAGVIIIIIISLSLIYQRFLAPDKVTLQKYDSISNAQQLMATGDFSKALDQINLVLASTPNDPDLLIYKGVLLIKLGRNGEAALIFSQAESILKNHELLLSTRTLLYLQAGDPQSAQVSAKELIAYNPKSAEGYFFLAKSLEILGDQANAIDNYNQAYTLADSQGKSELAATIKISMAMLMQSMNSSLPTFEPTPMK